MATNSGSIIELKTKMDSKYFYLCILVLALIACNNSIDASDSTVSTVDSNTIRQGDSTPPILYIDSAQTDTTFSVAMDSAGPTINPEDTNYINRR